MFLSIENQLNWIQTLALFLRWHNGIIGDKWQQKISFGISKSKQCLPTNHLLKHLNGCLEKAPSTSALKASFISTMSSTTSTTTPFRRENERKLPPSLSKWVTIVSLHSAFSKEVAKFYRGSLHILSAESCCGQTRSDNALLSKDGGVLGKDRGWDSCHLWELTSFQYILIVYGCPGTCCLFL